MRAIAAVRRWGKEHPLGRALLRRPYRYLRGALGPGVVFATATVPLLAGLALARRVGSLAVRLRRSRGGIERPRLLCLVEGDPARGLSPASRFRVYQHVPRLEAAGFRVEVRPSRPSKYFTARASWRRFASRWPRMARLVYAVNLARMRLNRLGDLLRALHADVVLLQRDLVPGASARLEHLLCALHPAVAFDLDDAVWSRPSWSPAPDGSLVDRALEAKIVSILGGVRHAIVSTEYLRAFVRPHVQEVSVVPTAVDVDRFRPRGEARPRGGPVIIGWIGTSGNLYYFRGLEPAFAALARRFDVRLRIVCNRPDPDELPQLPEGLLEFVEWRLDRELEEFARVDIGIMPLADDPWTRGKASFKLLQFMAVGVPVVCSPVGFNREVVRDGVEGFFAADPAEWEDRLARLIADPDLRAVMGLRGRATAEARFSAEPTACTLAAILRGLLQSGDEVDVRLHARA